MRVRDGMNEIVAAVGILSMRDIVRCWPSAGATSEVEAPVSAR